MNPLGERHVASSEIGWISAASPAIDCTPAEPSGSPGMSSAPERLDLSCQCPQSQMKEPVSRTRSVADGHAHRGTRPDSHSVWICGGDSLVFRVDKSPSYFASGATSIFRS